LLMGSAPSFRSRHAGRGSSAGLRVPVRLVLIWRTQAARRVGCRPARISVARSGPLRVLRDVGARGPSCGRRSRAPWCARPGPTSLALAPPPRSAACGRLRFWCLPSSSLTRDWRPAREVWLRVICGRPYAFVSSFPFLAPPLGLVSGAVSAPVVRAVRSPLDQWLRGAAWPRPVVLTSHRECIHGGEVMQMRVSVGVQGVCKEPCNGVTTCNHERGARSGARRAGHRAPCQPSSSARPWLDGPAAARAEHSECVHGCVAS